MRSNIKILLFTTALIVLLSVFAIGLKFANFAKNIYEFENPSQTEIIDQFKQVVMKDDTTIKTNPDGTTNILLMGVAGPGHNGENLTDTLMVVTISADRKNVALSSIPRDLYVELPNSQYWSRINSIYGYSGKTDAREGVKALAGKVKEISGLPINYYILLDFKGFKKLIDEIGGIDYTLEKDLNDPAFPNDSFGYDPLYLKAGDYHLDGDLALKLARSRHTLQGDFSRIERQHKIMKALREKMEDQKVWGNVFAINNILNIVGENMKTNITLPEFQKINSIAKSISTDNIASKIPEANPDSKQSLLYAAKVNEAEVLLPKDPTYEGLRLFYSGKELSMEADPKDQELEITEKQSYAASGNQPLVNQNSENQPVNWRTNPSPSPAASISPSPDESISPSPSISPLPSPNDLASPRLSGDQSETNE